MPHTHTHTHTHTHKGLDESGGLHVCPKCSDEFSNVYDMYEHLRDCGGSAAPGVCVRVCMCVWVLISDLPTQSYVSYAHAHDIYSCTCVT